MDNLLKKKLLLLLILSLSFSDNNVRLNSLLFCIKKTEKNIIIYNKNNFQTDNEKLNILLELVEESSIEPWLPGATSNDSSGDIYLNRIYRLNFTQRSLEQIDEIKNKIELMDIIHSVEFEYLRVPLYTPNDQYYNNQWYLPEINSNSALYFDPDNIVEISKYKRCFSFAECISSTFGAREHCQVPMDRS